MVKKYNGSQWKWQWLFDYQQSSKYLLLCSAEASNSYKFGMTWEGVNDNLFYFRVDYALKKHKHSFKWKNTLRWLGYVNSCFALSCVISLLLSVVVEFTLGLWQSPKYSQDLTVKWPVCASMLHFNFSLFRRHHIISRIAYVSVLCSHNVRITAFKIFCSDKFVSLGSEIIIYKSWGSKKVHCVPNL